MELLARFEDTDFLRSQFRLADFVADVERRHRESDKLVCLAVDADEAGDCVAFGILQVDDSSEVADGFEAYPCPLLRISRRETHRSDWVPDG